MRCSKEGGEGAYVPEIEHTYAQLLAEPHLAMKFGKYGLKRVAKCQTKYQAFYYHRGTQEPTIWTQPEISATFIENSCFSNIVQCLLKTVHHM